MRLAISTENGAVAAHFGRCPHYTLIDIENGAETGRTVVENPGHEPGRIPAFLRDHDANVVIAGGMGRRAQELFNAMGIEQLVGIQGRIDDVVSRCISGTLAAGESLCSHPDGHGDGHSHGGHHDGMHHHGHH
jgi:predicted Fe-Mo cluster-binding NifX family protein